MKQYLFIKGTDADEIRAKVQVNDVDANQHVTVLYMEGCKETYFGGVIPFKLGDVIHLTDIFTLAQTLSNEGVRVIEYNGDAEPKKLITSPELTITSSTTLSLEEEATSDITCTSKSAGAVTYKSSSEAVATVSDAGKITAVAAGTCTITVSQAQDGEYSPESKTIAVTVTAKADDNNGGGGEG